MQYDSKPSGGYRSKDMQQVKVVPMPKSAPMSAITNADGKLMDGSKERKQSMPKGTV